MILLPRITTRLRSRCVCLDLRRSLSNDMPACLSFRPSSASFQPLHCLLCAGWHASNTNENPAHPGISFSGNRLRESRFIGFSRGAARTKSPTHDSQVGLAHRTCIAQVLLPSSTPIEPDQLQDLTGKLGPYLVPGEAPAPVALARTRQVHPVIPIETQQILHGQDSQVRARGQGAAD